MAVSLVVWWGWGWQCHWYGVGAAGDDRDISDDGLARDGSAIDGGGEARPSDGVIRGGGEAWDDGDIGCGGEARPSDGVIRGGGEAWDVGDIGCGAEARPSDGVIRGGGEAWDGSAIDGGGEARPSDGVIRGGGEAWDDGDIGCGGEVWDDGDIVGTPPNYLHHYHDEITANGQYFGIIICDMMNTAHPQQLVVCHLVLSAIPACAVQTGYHDLWSVETIPGSSGYEIEKLLSGQGNCSSAVTPRMPRTVTPSFHNSWDLVTW